MSDLQREMEREIKEYEKKLNAARTDAYHFKEDFINLEREIKEREIKERVIKLWKRLKKLIKKKEQLKLDLQ